MIIAAKTNSADAIKLLLNRKADPNIKDKEGFTALTYGILEENVEATELLLPITTEKLDVSLVTLAKTTSTFEVSQSIKDEIKNIISTNKSLLWTFLEKVSFFGNYLWLGWFMKNFPEEKSYFEKLETILRNVIMSCDNDHSISTM